MSNLIKIPSTRISEIEFEVKNIYCLDSDYESFEYPVGENPETGEIYEETNYSRQAWGRVDYVATYEGQVLKLSFDWEACANNKDSYKDSYDFDVDFAREPSSEINFVFIDEDGDIENVTIEVIERDAGAFEDFRVSAAPLLPQIEDSEVFECDLAVETDEVEEFIVERDNDVDLKFKGQILASATSRPACRDGGRWFVLTLYKTAGGKYICQKEEITIWVGERNRYKAVVCETIDEVKEFFGSGWVSKEIYAEAGIAHIQIVD